MKKNTVYKMAGIVSMGVALLSTGCQTLKAGRTAFNDGDDPYENSESAVTNIRPVDVEVAGTAESADNSGASYQKFVIPEGYHDPTEGLEKRSGKSLPAPRPTKAEADNPVKPASDASDQASAPEGFIIYTVKSGDSLSVIANSHGVRTAELAQINGIAKENWGKIRVGQKLKVPKGRKPFASTSSSKGSGKKLEPGQYRVVSGDALSLIAQRFGVKTADIVKANNLKNADAIYVGQILRIPGAAAQASGSVSSAAAESKKEEVKRPSGGIVPPAGIVKDAAPAADAVTSPAKAVDELPLPPPLPALPSEADGGIDISSLVVPQIGTGSFTASSVLGSDYGTLKVEEGQTLEAIALRYGCTKEDLLKLNSFPPDKVLKKDDIIKVPRN